MEVILPDGIKISEIEIGDGGLKGELYMPEVDESIDKQQYLCTGTILYFHGLTLLSNLSTACVRHGNACVRAGCACVPRVRALAGACGRLRRGAVCVACV